MAHIFVEDADPDHDVFLSFCAEAGGVKIPGSQRDAHASSTFSRRECTRDELVGSNCRASTRLPIINI